MIAGRDRAHGQFNLPREMTFFRRVVGQCDASPEGVAAATPRPRSSAALHRPPAVLA